MTDNKNDLRVNLMQEEIQTPEPAKADLSFHQTEYKTYASAPQITLSGLSLILICPLLLAGHLYVAKVAQIPIIQYSFVTLLVAFLINYTLIVRKYEIMPFLPE